MVIKLGVIGSSEGNGHPYSWSAICNGYSEREMKKCPFPAIPLYLSRQTFPRDQIKDAKVTHVWTQDVREASRIAKASLIPNVAISLEHLCESVDMILLARDDAENHFELAEIVCSYGKPVFIDKPLAYSTREAKKIFTLETYPGQIFTCSSLRFAKELTVSPDKIKGTNFIDAKVPKDWAKYAIHVLEPIISQFKVNDFKRMNTYSHGNLRTVVFYSKKKRLHLRVCCTGKLASQIEFTIHGSVVKTYTFTDSFSCFKSSIEAFLATSLSGKPSIGRQETLNIIKLIEQGLK